LAGEARLGATHSEAGAWLLSRANPQSFIADAVLYHHERTDRIQDAFPLTKIVYVANRLCPETIQDRKFKFDVAEDLFGFSASEVEEIIVQAQGEVKDAAHSLGIDIASLERSGQAISDKNHKKQQDLIREAREISLLGCTLQNLLKAYDEDAILKVLHEGFRILLDVKQTYFFLYESESHLLIGKDVASEGEDSLINELSIPFHKGNSLFVKSLHQRMPVHSFGNSKQANPAIIDEQVIRLIGKDGILCIPMFANEQPIGITFFGVDEDRLSHLLRREKLLTIFCSQGAAALHAYHLRQSQIKPIQPEPLSTSPVTRKVLHNLNTPLNIVKNYLTIVGRKLAEENRVQEELGIINEEIGRIALMIRELSEFSEPEAQPEDRQDVNALLADFVRIFQKSLLPGPDIQFHLNLDPALPAVVTKKNSLKQVFINLFENAVEAMPKGGNLYIGTRHLPEGPDIKTGQEWKAYLGYVEITIRDDGPGIPEAIRPQLFEPLVTSKGEGHAGLGLSIVHDMVKELEGSITYETGDQAGTSFRIILPIG
jgi:signal transduction histidine kinase